MRPEHVLTQLEPYGVRVENLVVDGHTTGSKAQITVSDAAAEWAEYLVLRSGRFGLLSGPLNPKNVKWAAKWHTMPAQKGCNGHSQQGTVGRMPTPWSEQKHQPRAKTKKPVEQRSVGKLSGLLDGLRRKPQRRSR